MATRRLTLATLLVALASWGMTCPGGTGIVLTIVSPGSGAAVGTCTFDIEVTVGGTADPTTLTADIDGDAVTLVEDPPASGTYTATGMELSTGAHTLTVRVENTTGGAAIRFGNFTYQSPDLVAREILLPGDLIDGPQASGRIGDYLLQNCKARFIVQDAPQRDLTGIGQFGGNLIDAELRSRPGLDSFFEIQPMLNIETVVNATSVVVVNDGSNGLPAILRSCGPDDPIDYINANTLVDDLLGAGAFPASANDVDLPITGCTEYALAPGDTHVEMITTVENTSATDVDIYVGDYINGSGAVEQWTSELPTLNPAGLTSGIGEMAVNFGFEVLSMFGFEAVEGVDYGYIPKSFVPIPPFSINFPSSSFAQTGVNAVLHSNIIINVLFLGFPPVFRVPAGGTNSFERLFSVGDGSAGNALDLRFERDGVATGTLEGCVTVGGSPAPGTRVVAGKALSGAIEELSSHWVTDADGCYEGTLRPGTYGVAAARLGTPYEGGVGVPTPTLHTVAVVTDTVVTQDIALPATGRVEVSVVDETSSPVPGRVVVVGTDPSPHILNSFNLAGVLDITTSLFHDATKDSIPAGITWVAYAGASGTTAFDLEPGTYDIVVTRGTEYSSYTETVVVSASPAPPTVVSAQIAHVVETPGFVSSDFHVHLDPSTDSPISVVKRITSFAGEGVDNIITTDHDRHTDLVPMIAAEGLTPFVNATIGEEITTFDYGHFNAYPLEIDPDRVSGGSTDWALPAAPGAGFPTSTPPAFTGTPEEIFDLVFTTPKVAGGVLNTSSEIAVQVNHIGGHYGPLKIDSSLTPPSSQLTDAEKEARRFCSTAIASGPGSCADLGELFFQYPALELWNGYTRNQQLDEFVDERLGIWANQLNQGILATAIYDTDTHDFFTTRTGGARSWTPSTSDLPSMVDDDEVGKAVNAGKVVGGQGIYVQARIRTTAGTPREVGFELADDTLMRADTGDVELEVKVQAPTWAPYDRIDVYRNPTTTVTGCNGSTPVQFTANVTDTFTQGAGDFAVSTVNVFPSVPGAERLETTFTVGYTLTEDTWFAVIVRGTDGISASMFPEMPASVSQGGVLAMGATNALFVDVDTNAGVYDPPGVTCTNCATFCP